MTEYHLEGRSWHRIKLPAPWQLSTLPGDQGVQYLRQFQRPTGLTDQSRIVIEVQLRDGGRSGPSPDDRALDLTIQLNGNDLHAPHCSELVYQTAIQPSQLLSVNQLAIRLRLPEGSLQRPHFLSDALDSMSLLLGP